MASNPESLTPEALETLLKEAHDDCWSGDTADKACEDWHPTDVSKWCIKCRLSAALRSLLASHATTEAEAFKAGWAARHDVHMRAGAPGQIEALAAYLRLVEDRSQG